MSKSLFKIGDHVYEIMTGQNYKIIADKQTPYLHNMMGELYPNPGNDFLLAPLRKLEPGEFAAFVHAPAAHLEPEKN